MANTDNKINFNQIINCLGIFIGVRTGAANAAFAAPDNLFWIKWAGRYLFERYT
jgi:hypothetical protein